MSLLYQKHASRPLTLDNRVEPELYRDVFPYTHVSRIEFDDTFLVPRPADPMFITDTTFRDGQQARPPYTVKQIARIYDLLHKLGGKSGLIQASEFFMYSPKDRKAIEVCRSRGYRFPRVTGWIRANMDDLKIAHDMEFDEVGLLTSMSDYHIFLKLGKTREQAMNDYLKVVTKLGISSVSDSITIIVSEETGVISMARDGKLVRYIDSKALRNLLESIFIHKEREFQMPSLSSFRRRKGNQK